MTFRKVTRTSQPQGPVGIDWGNPVTKGLVTALLGSSTKNLALYSDYTNIRGTKNSVTRVGTSWDFEFASQQYLTSSNKIVRGPPFTVLSLTLFKGLTGAPASQAVWAIDANADSSYTEVYFQSSTSRLCFEVAEGGTYDLIRPLTPIEFNRLYNITAVSESYFHRKLFIDGQSQGTSTVSVVTQPAITNTIGAWDAVTENGYSLAKVPLVLMFTRALSDAEVFSLYDNPWQVFSPTREPIFVEATTQITIPTLGYASQVTQQGAWAPTTTIPNDLASIDANFVSVASSTPLELLLEETFYPGSNFQTLTYQARSSTGSTLTVVLKQGSTVIMTTNHVLSSIEQIFTDVLTAPEIALITAGPLSVTLTAS